MINFPEPHFIDRDPEAITADLVARYEYLSGKTLYPAQVERLMIDLIAYAKTLTHIGINEAGKQNLVRFSSTPILGYLGEQINVPKLSASNAKTMLRFTLPASRLVDLAIPAGTLVDSSDGKVTFATDAAVTLPVGSLTVDCAATCSEAGVIGNGWLPGQINTLTSDIGNVVISVANITVSADGTEDESDDRYRLRIMEGPEAFSVAGPRGAYRWHAMSAHPDIIDVGVIGPEMAKVNGVFVSTNGVPPGEIRIYPLVASGVPDANILSLVDARLSLETVRPLCDFPQVLPIEPVVYTIDAGLVLFDTSTDTSVALDASEPVKAARKAAQAHADYLQAGVGRDVVVKAFEALLKVPGVYDLSIPSLPANLVLGDHQYARCIAINVNVTGVVRG